MLFNLKILKFEDAITFQVIKIIYQHYKGELPLEVTKLFQLNKSVSLRNSRYCNHLFIPSINSSLNGKSSLRYKDPVTWNKINKMLNCELQNVSFMQLKKQLKDYFFKKYELN